MVRELFNSGVQMISIIHNIIYTESTKASILTGVACTTMLYTCCRDGKAKENHQPRKTTKTRKHPGSRKQDAYCISQMTVTKGKSGTVSVRYIQTHTNHTPGIGEVKHIPLPQAVRQEVKEKYGQNVKLDSIIDGMPFT